MIATARRAVLVPALGLALCLLAVEWARVLAAREWPLAGQVAGGAALCLCLALYPPGVLGLGRMGSAVAHRLPASWGAPP